MNLYEKAWQLIEQRRASYPAEWFNSDGSVNTANPEAQNEAARLVDEMTRER